MKKIIALILAVLLAAGMFAGCKQQAADPTAETTGNNESSQPTQATDAQQTEPSDESSGESSSTTATEETDPTEGTEESTPTEGTEETRPTEAPADTTEPTAAPTEPTAAPTEPTAAPTEPVKPAPVIPSEPGKDTTELAPLPTEPAPTPTVHTHRYSSKVTASSCTAGGYTTYVCACGDSYTDQKTAATGHYYSKKVVAPTCTDKGYTAYACSACGHSYTDSKTAAKGHSWGQWAVTKAPTTSAAGTEERRCSACGDSETRSIPKVQATVGEMQQEVLRLVNIEREKAGLAPLEYVSAAQSAADIRTAEIQRSFSHTRPDGSSCFTVLEGLPINYYTAGENIAYGYTTPEAVVDAWMNSDGHRANILNPKYTGLAVGVENNHWVQLFIGS